LHGWIQALIEDQGFIRTSVVRRSGYRPATRSSIRVIPVIRVIRRSHLSARSALESIHFDPPSNPPAIRSSNQPIISM
jgi:hypothetical protein